MTSSFDPSVPLETVVKELNRDAGSAPATNWTSCNSANRISANQNFKPLMNAFIIPPFPSSACSERMWNRSRAVRYVPTAVPVRKKAAMNANVRNASRATPIREISENNLNARLLSYLPKRDIIASAEHRANPVETKRKVESMKIDVPLFNRELITNILNARDDLPEG